MIYKGKIALMAAIVATIVLAGCASQQEKIVQEDASAEETSPEETELSDNLNDLQELDQFEEGDLSFDELEAMVEE